MMVPEMQDGSAVSVYPSAFNHGVLTCSIDGSRQLSTLYFENTMDTWFVQLSVPKDLFQEGGSQFRVDLLEAVDGGQSILTICDVHRLSGRDVSDMPLSQRLLLIDQTFFHEGESFDADEFRIMRPRLRPSSEIHRVITFDCHNHPGRCVGAAFTNDTYNRNTRPSEGTFLVRKSRYPEVYELFIDGVQPAPGNNVAYIPTLEMSKKLKGLFAERNSLTLPFHFHEARQKWVPVI
jgi:hypothetical protein